jgi:hypothetical protein
MTLSIIRPTNSKSWVIVLLIQYAQIVTEIFIYGLYSMKFSVIDLVVIVTTDEYVGEKDQQLV